MSRLKELETWFWFYLSLMGCGVMLFVVAQVVLIFKVELVGVGLFVLGFTLIALNTKEWLKCRSNEQ